MLADLTLDDFDFELPPDLIAQMPAPERSAARLLDATGEQIIDRHFHALPQILKKGDLLIFNDTRVMRARLFGQKISGGQLEILVERILPAPTPNAPALDVLAHMKVSRKPAAGTRIRLAASSAQLASGAGFEATVVGREQGEDGREGLFHLRLHPSGDAADAFALIEAHGHLPLPPYIERAQNAAAPDARAALDEQRYQSVFARVHGAVAAPTASLHFDAPVLQALAERGIERAPVTLHVGAGTFAPVKVSRIAEHTMHREWYEVPEATREAIARTRAAGGRIVAVGTTSARALESWAHSAEHCADTRIFITPGFEWKMVDVLITNFHLPRSTLLMLVAAFLTQNQSSKNPKNGIERMQQIYAHAIKEKYRFFSYGDAMILSAQHLKAQTV